MSLPLPLDGIFIPDAVVEMVSQEQCVGILNSFALAETGGGGAVFEYLWQIGRCGSSIDDDAEVSDRRAWINEGKRQAALEVLAVLRCAKMDAEELQELLTSRG